jgi:DNA-binding MarR family transcriptional regulator
VASSARPREMPKATGDRGRSNPTADADSASALAQALITLYVELDDVYNQAARGLRLTSQQAQLLCNCEHQPASMTHLAELLNCDKTNITGLVDRVAKRALVTRSIDQNDRRVSQVTLTRQGKQLVQRFQSELQQRLDERLSHWPSARRRQLINLATHAATELAKEPAAS